jgi:Fe-S cluster biosynthesis and repair protein YggX
MGEQRMVLCSRYKAELPGLEKPPIKGVAGQRIYDNVSQKAWEEWRNDLQMKVLNEYRLNMAKPEDYQFLIDQMLAFLNLKDGKVAEVENEARGKGGM